MAVRDALRVAMKMADVDADEVRELCRDVFGVESFADLYEPDAQDPTHKQWTLVCLIEPDTIGPYGESMKPF